MKSVLKTGWQGIDPWGVITVEETKSFTAWKAVQGFSKTWKDGKVKTGGDKPSLLFGTAETEQMLIWPLSRFYLRAKGRKV